MKIDVASQTGQQIIRLEHEWTEAVSRRDAATLNHLLADEFLIAGWLPGGRLGDKRLYVEDCLRVVEVREATYRFEGWEMRAYGEAVLANCLFECRAIVAGQEWGGRFLLTDVWVKGGGGWRVVARHSSPVLST